VQVQAQEDAREEKEAHAGAANVATLGAYICNAPHTVQPERSSEPGLFVRLFVCFSAACRQLDCADDEDAAG
jgi:hypothetical protein